MCLSLVLGKTLNSCCCFFVRIQYVSVMVLMMSLKYVKEKKGQICGDCEAAPVLEYNII